METSTPVDNQLPPHVKMAIVHNPHKEVGLSATDFINSHNLPESAARPEDLMVVNETDSLWMCIWSEDGMAEDECNLIFASTLADLIARLDNYRVITLSITEKQNARNNT